MSANRLICAVNSSSKAAYKSIDLPSLFLVLPELVWLRRIRRVLFQNDFCFKFIYLIFFFFFYNFLLVFFI